MRPRRLILLVSSSENILADRGFMLDTRGFKTLRANSAAVAIEIFCARRVDVVVIDLDLGAGLGDRDGRWLVDELRTVSKPMLADVPMILVSAITESGSIAHPADCFLGKGHCAPIDLFEWVKAMSTRKRGPRKKPPLPVLPAEGMAAIA